MNTARAAAMAVLLLVPAAAAASPADDLIGGMAKCAAIADNAARLGCYDALNPQLKAAEAAPPAPPVVAAPPPAAAPDERAWYDPSRYFGVNPTQQRTPAQFGSESLTAPPPPPGAPATPENTPPPALDSITSGVSEYSFTPYGKFIVILADGQIWQQLQSDSGTAHFAKSGPNSVTISRGTLGSYVLAIGDSMITFKVKRLK